MRVKLIGILFCAIFLVFKTPAFAQDSDDNVVRRAIDIVIENSAVNDPKGSDRARVSGKGEQRRNAQKIIRRLNSQRVNASFDKTGLLDALEFIRRVSGFNMVISKAVRQLIDDEKLTVNLKLNKVKLRNLLTLTLENCSGDLCFSIQKGILMINTKDEF